MFIFIENASLVAVLRDVHDVQSGWDVSLDRLEQLGEPGALVAKAHGHHSVDGRVNAFI